MKAVMRKGDGRDPTVTYPSHTTLMTGVWPAKHGILANQTFDPLQKNHEGWYWYAEDIRVPTLWDAASAAGRTTASIQWPVSSAQRLTGTFPKFGERALRGRETPARWFHARTAGGGKSGGGEYRGGTRQLQRAMKYAASMSVWIPGDQATGLLTCT